jgi:carboxymethylenebutenolidase
MDVPGKLADPSAVTAGPSTFEGPNGTVDAWLARPAGAGSRPGLIVIHEAFGPNDHIHDLTQRFAGAGFDALAPNLYHALGHPGDDMASVMEKMFQLTDADAVADLEAAAATLRALDSSNGKVGCIGFCSGGRHTLLFACSSTAVDAAVDCWGGFIERASPNDDVTPQRPRRVVDLLGDLSCPVFLVGGVEDQNPSPDLLAEVEGKLVAAGKDATVEIFEDAGHAFLADYRPSYREGPAHLLWPKIIDFLQGALS